MPLLPLRAATRGPAALRVVAFRDDDKQPLKKQPSMKRLDSLKMKTNEAKTVQRKNKQQLQKTINKREQCGLQVAASNKDPHCCMFQ